MARDNLCGEIAQNLNVSQRTEVEISDNMAQFNIN